MPWVEIVTAGTMSLHTHTLLPYKARCCKILSSSSNGPLRDLRGMAYVALCLGLILMHSRGTQGEPPIILYISYSDCSINSQRKKMSEGIGQSIHQLHFALKRYILHWLAYTYARSLENMAPKTSSASFILFWAPGSISGTLSDNELYHTQVITALHFSQIDLHAPILNIATNIQNPAYARLPQILIPT